jgi:hypothetical protein
MLYYANAGLRKLRESGEYNRIAERHLNAYWQSQTAPSPALGNLPATRANPVAAPPAKAAPASSGSSGQTSTAKSELPSK